MVSSSSNASHKETQNSCSFGLSGLAARSCNLNLTPEILPVLPAACLFHADVMILEATAVSCCFRCKLPMPGKLGGLRSFGLTWHAPGDSDPPTVSGNGDTAMEAVLLLPAVGYVQFHANVPDEEREDTAKEHGVKSLPVRSPRGVVS